MSHSPYEPAEGVGRGVDPDPSTVYEVGTEVSPGTAYGETYVAPPVDDLYAPVPVSGTSSNVLTDQPVTWAARTEDPGGKTSPEELVAAAHASCYAMAFSNTLAPGRPRSRVAGGHRGGDIRAGHRGDEVRADGGRQGSGTLGRGVQGVREAGRAGVPDLEPDPGRS